MPTYDYHCDACNHEFELFQSINDPLKRKCPACKKPKLRRLFGTGAAVVFKGSGFYQTDYRSESYKKGAEKEKPASDKPATDKSGDSKKGESQTESKGESKPKESKK